MSHSTWNNTVNVPRRPTTTTTTSASLPPYSSISIYDWVIINWSSTINTLLHTHTHTHTLLLLVLLYVANDNNESQVYADQTQHIYEEGTFYELTNGRSNVPNKLTQAAAAANKQASQQSNHTAFEFRASHITSVAFSSIWVSRIVVVSFVFHSSVRSFIRSFIRFFAHLRRSHQ